MGGLMGGPKVDTRAADRAEADAKAAELKAAAADKQSAADEEYRRKKQVGKAGTILSGVDDGTGRTLLGG